MPHLRPGNPIFTGDYSPKLPPGMVRCKQDGCCVKCGVSQPLNELDDLDSQEYAMRVVNPRWVGSFEDRVRCALERTGFVIERLDINPDDSMETFWVRRGQPLAHLECLGAARVALQAALTNVGCPCGEQELALRVEGNRWNGAYCPPVPADNIDPMHYVNALPPYP